MSKLETHKITTDTKDAGLITTCENCGQWAHWIILVPWIHIETRATGADWTAFCRRCKPDEPRWDVQKVNR